MVVTVATTPLGGTIGSSQSICNGGDPAAFTSITDPSGGKGTWTYSWEYKVGTGNWTVIPASNNLTYDVPAGLTTTTSYRRVASNDCGTSYSNTVTITINPLPTVMIIPSGNQSICEGSSIALNTNTGLGYTYKWFKNGALIPGETTSTLGVNEAGDYYVEITNFFGCSNTSTTTTISVKPVPVASISTTDNLIWCADDNVSVTFNAVDVPGATYQWYRNGNGLPGATSKLYTAHLAGVYEVMVTLNECVSTSNSIEVVINPLPVSTITTTDPLIYCADIPVNTTLNATPLAADSYQWYLNGNIIAGATSDSFMATEAGDYTVDVVLIGCDAKSEITTIVVNPLPTVTLGNFSPVCIDAIPLTLTGGVPINGVYSGNGVDNGVFTPSTAGAGTHTITYSYTDGNGCTNTATSDIAVNDLPVVTISSIADLCLNAEPLTLTQGSPDGGTYSGTGVTVSNFNPSVAQAGTHSITYSFTDSNGCTNTASTSVTVLDLPSVTLDAFADMCTDSSPITLSGGMPLVGDYFVDGTLSSTFDPFSAGAGIHNILYRYTDGNGCTNEASQTITVNNLPVVTITTTDPLVYCEGAAISTILSASPAGAESYQWLNNGVIINDATSQTYTATSAGSYSVVVTVNGCAATSNESEITITPLPVVAISTTDPLTYCMGETISTMFTAQPAGAESYQWFINGSPINGATAESLTADAGGNYSVEVTHNGCSSISTESAITVKPLPVVSINPDKLNYCEGESINTTFTALPSDADTYEWKHNGEIIAGATTSTYVATETGNYSVTVFQNGCSDSSPDSTIELHALPEVSIITSDPLSYCEGQTISTALTAETSGNVTYQWLSGGIPINGATNPSLNVTQAGVYSVSATNEFGCNTTSEEIAVEINTYPDPVITTVDPLLYCEGETIKTLFTAEPSGNYTYQWYLDGAEVVDSTKQTFSANAVGIYKVLVYSGVCSAMSAEISITTKPAPTFSVITTDPTTYCEGESINTTFRVNPTDAGSFQWYRDGNIIDAATLDTLNVTSAGNYTVEVVANGCSAISTINIITVNPLPLVTISTTDPLSYCFGEGISTTLNADPANANAYQWFLNGQAIDAATQESYVANAGGIYKVSATVNGCSAASEETEILIKELPVVSISTTDPTTYCDGVAINTTFTALPSGAESYEWLKNNSTVSGATSETYNTNSIGSYSVRITQNGCSDTSNVIDIVQVAQPIVDLGADFSACGSATLDAGPGVSYLWGTTYETTRTIKVKQSGLYSVTVTYAGGCSGSDNILVTVYPLPQVVLATDTIRINTHETYTLDAGSGFASYLWNDASTGQTLFVDGTILAPGIYSYWVEVTDNNSCTNSDTAVVELSLWTNIITNKGWIIEMYPNPTTGEFKLNIAGIKTNKVQLSIYNSSGKLLFVKDSYLKGNELQELLDISNFTKGIYLIRITDGKDYLTKKIILE